MDQEQEESAGRRSRFQNELLPELAPELRAVSHAMINAVLREWFAKRLVVALDGITVRLAPR
ncbi:hypothetical protein Nans01_06100 [Nocardiopsis ansamitocini]|uniref:Uncharacterized protein n=1 Tax=Nocardiopsis ansamitocini TaxID=1670832 RepID=A0A9W6P2W1_9ACTN|nr:hypothetical protein Nans01_06100 [Nocardiopsis ansamitocini]